MQRPNYEQSNVESLSTEREDVGQRDHAGRVASGIRHVDTMQMMFAHLVDDVLDAVVLVGGDERPAAQQGR